MDIKSFLSKVRHNRLAVVTIITLTIMLLILVFSKPIYSLYCADVNSTLKNECFYDGIKINDIDLSRKSLDEATSLVYKNANDLKKNTSITVNCNEKVVTLTSDNFEYDKEKIDETLKQAYRVGREDDSFFNYLKVKFMKFSPKNITLPLVFTDESVNSVVEHVSFEVDDKKVDAHVLTFSPQSDRIFTYEDGHDGMEIDKNELKQKILKILETEHIGKIDIERHFVKNTTSIEDIRRNTCLISEFSTISTNNANGNSNMKLSMNFVNGTKLNPGEVFSFNKIVGDSNKASRGFLPAAAILNGEIIMAYGGGICQSATTIYGAAIRANMTIKERANHRYKSSYVPYGEDATIDYGNIDLKFKNDLEMPVYISADMTGNKLNCKIYGPRCNDYDKIEVKSSVCSSAGITNVKTQRVFYKNGSEVYSEDLPSSSYR